MTDNMFEPSYMTQLRQIENRAYILSLFNRDDDDDYEIIPNPNAVTRIIDVEDNSFFADEEVFAI